MEHGEGSPDNGDQFDRMEVEIKQDLVDVEEEILQATASLEKAERRHLELIDLNRIQKETGQKPFNEDQHLKRIEIIKKNIAQLEDLRKTLHRQLINFYEIDEKRHQNDN